jgi:hypothetical protein
MIQMAAYAEMMMSTGLSHGQGASRYPKEDCSPELRFADDQPRCDRTDPPTDCLFQSGPRVAYFRTVPLELTPDTDDQHRRQD